MVAPVEDIITEALIDRVVRTFYASVQTDPQLGPIFAARITNWDAHLNRMCAFWSSVLLMSGRYHGQPMQLHQGLPVDARHFDRWLELFAQTARSICPPVAAEQFVSRAERIAESLELGIAASRGGWLRKGERLAPASADSA
ncbi:group III truncated hemoglobin [Govanella unica]|nr:group III truncated hemoglobin [Govania unica]